MSTVITIAVEGLCFFHPKEFLLNIRGIESINSHQLSLRAVTSLPLCSFPSEFPMTTIESDRSALTGECANQKAARRNIKCATGRHLKWDEL